MARTVLGHPLGGLGRPVGGPDEERHRMPQSHRAHPPVDHRLGSPFSSRSTRREWSTPIQKMLGSSRSDVGRALQPEDQRGHMGVDVPDGAARAEPARIALRARRSRAAEVRLRMSLSNLRCSRLRRNLMRH